MTHDLCPRSASTLMTVSIRRIFVAPSNAERMTLWSSTPHSLRCAKALDNLEAQLQHTIAPISTWEQREFPMVFTKMDPWCRHDAALQALCDAIKQDACSKMEAAGINPADHKPREIGRTEIQR